MKLVVQLVVATALKWLMFQLLDESIQLFPHFVTPLNDIKELREQFYMYETKGDFYYSENCIGQSEYLLLLYYQIQKHIAIEWVLALSDFLSTLMQLYILNQLKPKYLSVLQLGVIFNPASIFGGGIQNIGALNDTIYYTLIALIINGSKY